MQRTDAVPAATEPLFSTATRLAGLLDEWDASLCRMRAALDRTEELLRRLSDLDSAERDVPAPRLQ